MEITSRLPNELNMVIMDYMWGTRKGYQLILGKVLSRLPTNVQLNLKATEYCKYKNKVWNDIEDNLYCPKCGEKSLHFTYVCLGRLCEYCNN